MRHLLAIAVLLLVTIAVRAQSPPMTITTALPEQVNPPPQPGECEYLSDQRHNLPSVGLPSLRTSVTHPRAIGLGDPLRGTSWLNRPYEFSLETGLLAMANDVGDGTGKANDLLVAAQLGWDFDHYWGTQVRVAWSSPSFDYETAPVTDASNDLAIYDASLLYYPWGDSRVRPYWRAGLGLTDIDYVDTTGMPASASLFTIPLAIGLKYQKERWMAIRFEAADNIAFGQGGTNTLNNFTFTFGAEWRFGGRPAPGWRREGNRHLQ